MSYDLRRSGSDLLTSDVAHLAMVKMKKTAHRPPKPLNGLGMCLNDGGNSKEGYVNNVLNDNNGGNATPQLYGGVQMGTNICGGDTVCP